MDQVCMFLITSLQHMHNFAVVVLFTCSPLTFWVNSDCCVSPTFLLCHQWCFGRVWLTSKLLQQFWSLKLVLFQVLSAYLLFIFFLLHYRGVLLWLFFTLLEILCLFCSRAINIYYPFLIECYTYVFSYCFASFTGNDIPPESPLPSNHSTEVEEEGYQVFAEMLCKNRLFSGVLCRVKQHFSICGIICHVFSFVCLFTASINKGPDKRTERITASTPRKALLGQLLC